MENKALSEFKSKFLSQIDYLKVRIFGQNNEKLDFLIDSFNKLESGQQKGVLAIGFGLVIGFVIMAFAIYFSYVSSLRHNLNESFTAIRQLEGISSQYVLEKKRYKNLVNRFKRKSDKLGSLKSYFEKLSIQESVSIGSLNEKIMKINDDNSLSENMNEVKIEISADKISIPKLLEYVSEVEKGGNFLNVSDLKIRSRYGTKLYFDTKMIFKGYKLK